MEVEEKIAVALHPPRCPKCNEELTHLVNICDNWMEYKFRLRDDGWGDYDLEKSEAGNHSEYGCPACRTTLFDNEDEAMAFLKGEEEPNFGGIWRTRRLHRRYP